MKLKKFKKAGIYPVNHQYIYCDYSRKALQKGHFFEKFKILIIIYKVNSLSKCFICDIEDIIGNVIKIFEVS